MSKTLTLFLRPDGTTLALHDDDLAPVLDGARVAYVERASEIEPCPFNHRRWQADMARVGGPILRGSNGLGFATRAEALAEEKRWLEENYLSRSSQLLD